MFKITAHGCQHREGLPGSKISLTDAVTTNYTGDTTPYGGITPAEMRGAYGVPSISFSGTAGTGAGETIAILDPGDDTALVNSTAPNFSTSDLGIFDSYYGIAAIDAAASSMHIGILSMSFGGAESQFGSTAEEEAYDAYYFDNPGLVYCASTGDFGAYEEGGATIGANFPASSSNVLAVGGTTLSVSGNNYSSETTLGERN